MPRPLKVDRPIEKKISLPQSLVARVDLQLYSNLEGKVPFGSWSGVVQELLESWLREKASKEQTC